MKRVAAALLMSLAAPGVALADTGAAASIEGLQKSLTTMEHSGGNFAAKEAIIAPAIDGAFDLETILKNSVGLRYTTIDATARAKLLATFRDYTLANYVSNFGTGDNTFTVSPDTRQSGSDVIVQTSIAPASGSPTRVDYVMRNTGAGYKAVDVLLDGTMSRVAVNRSDFRAAFEQGGASGLEVTLQRKTASLTGG